MMMLVGSDRLFNDTVYIRLPEHMSASFPDYQPSEAPSESRVVGLYGQRDLKMHIKMKP
jgi:hypothetical protein